MEDRIKPDFSKHEFRYMKDTYCTIFELKHTNYEKMYRIRFTNIDGHLVVTGDYGNWIFCREFHPHAGGGVSSGYWCEKLRINSEQDSHDFSEEKTANAIRTLLTEEEDLTEEEIEYLNGCLDSFTGCEFDYNAFAYRNNIGRFQDYEYVPFEKVIKPQLQFVFDAFDEMCDRLKGHNIEEFNINNNINNNE